MEAEEPEDKEVWRPARAVAADYSGRSNLAMAFLCLPKEKRRDMDVFYTFCRLVDDIADSPSLPPEQKAEFLNHWRAALQSSPSPAASPTNSLLVDQIHHLIAKYHLPVEHFLEIIAGVEMDITSRHYATFEQLRAYC